MGKKVSLAEAAGDILRGNLATKDAEQDKFGVGKTLKPTPGQTGKAVDFGGPYTDTSDNGTSQSSDAGPDGPEYPGAKPPVGQEPRSDIKRGSWNGKDRAKVNDSGVVTEEPEEMSEEDHSKFETDTTHPSESLGAQTFKEEKDEDEDEDDNDDDDKDDDKDDKKDLEEEGTGEHSGPLGGPQPVANIVKSYFNKKDALEEDIQAMFRGEAISEHFVEKAKTIYEAAVINKTTEIVEDIEAHYAEQLENTIEEIKESLAAKVDDYLNYMVEDWVKDNEIAIERGIRAELTEDFITGLKNLFVEHYIDIPEDKVDVVEELAVKVEDLEARLNEEIERGVDQKKVINGYKKNEVINQVTEGLADTQVAKVKKLAETVEFTTEKEFAEKVKTLRESYFPAEKKAPKIKQLDEETVIGDDRGVVEEKIVSQDPEIDAVFAAISRGVKR